jgi:hypothetical protein
VGLELIPESKRGVPFVPTQEIFRLPLNDGELRLLAELFQSIQVKNPAWIKEPFVDRLYTKVAFLYLMGKVMFAEAKASATDVRQQLDGLLKLHDILSTQVQELKRLEAETRARVAAPAAQGAPKPAQGGKP